jgi:hypothetical protein
MRMRSLKKILVGKALRSWNFLSSPTRLDRDPKIVGDHLQKKNLGNNLNTPPHRGIILRIIYFSARSLFGLNFFARTTIQDSCPPTIKSTTQQTGKSQTRRADHGEKIFAIITIVAEKKKNPRGTPSLPTGNHEVPKVMIDSTRTESWFNSSCS